jgi:hypothetical protein
LANTSVVRAERSVDAVVCGFCISRDVSCNGIQTPFFKKRMPRDRMIAAKRTAKIETAPVCAWKKKRPNKMTKPPWGGTALSPGEFREFMGSLRRNPAYIYRYNSTEI